MKKSVMTFLTVSLFAAATANAQEKQTLKFSHIFPESVYLWPHGGKIFADAIVEATGGKVEFEVYPAAQLGKDQLALLRGGLADVIITPTAYYPDKLPLSSVAELPGFIQSSCDGANKIWEMTREGGILAELEYGPQDLHVLYASAPPPYMITTSRTPVASLEDMKGLKLRVAGAAQNESVRALGGTPVQMPATDLYDSASRGTVDGAVYDFIAMTPFSLDEVINHVTQGVYLGSLAVQVAMRKSDWDAMSDEMKQIFSDAATKAQNELCAYQDQEEKILQEQFVAESGVVITPLSDDEVARWLQALEPVSAAWAEKLDAAGHQGTEVLEAFQSLSK